MYQYVKNTILSIVGDILAPHYCYGCDNTGSLLCVYCKYDIDAGTLLRCFSCKSPIGRGDICSSCRLPYSRQWVVGAKNDMIEQMIYDFKFERRGSMASPLAELLSDAIGILPEGVTIVPIPTISSHIRQRGYDHTLLLARHLAKLQNCSFEQLLTRKTSSRQRGAPRAQRIRQANEAFMASSHLDNSRTYLLLDDVTTTGATLAAAARELRNSGAHTVWTACIAYQAMSGGDEQSAGFHK